MLRIFIANSFYIFALGMIIPSLPFMVLSRGGDPVLTSIIFTAFSAAAFLSAPLWGICADKYGAKNTLIASAFLTSISYFLILLSHNVTELFIIRIFAGFSAGWLAASMTYMANISDKKNRTKAMGMLGASFGLGFTLGPASSGIILQSFSYEATALISMLITLIVALSSIFLLPASQNMTLKDDTATEKRAFLPNINAISKIANLKLLFFCYFIVLIIFNSLEGSFALWIKYVLSKDADFLAWLLTSAGIVSIIIQGGLLGRLNRLFAEKSLLLTGILLIIAGFLILPFAQNQYIAFLPVILVAAGLGLHNPCVQSLVSQSVTHEQHGILLGSLQSCASLSRIIGSSFAAFAFLALGVHIFYIGSAMILLMIFIFLSSRLVNYQKHNDNQ